MNIDVNKVLTETPSEFNDIFPNIDFSSMSNDILTESIIGNISSLISKAKTMIGKQNRTMQSKKVMSHEFYKKWDRVYTDDEFNIYEKMNKKIFRLNTDLSMYDILTMIGLNVDKNIIKKKGYIDLNEMRSLIVTGCIRHNVQYMKKMVTTQLYNGIFIGDDKTTKKIITPTENNHLSNMIQGRVLGRKLRDEIDTDVFLFNAREIPLIVKYNASLIQRFEDESKIVMSYITKAIKEHNDIREFPVFLDVFNYTVDVVVNMVLEYNEAILFVLDEMDKIYNICEKSSLHESVVGYAEMDNYIEPIDETFTKLEKTEMDISYFGIPRLKKYPLVTEKQIRAAINDFENVDNEADKKEMAKQIVKRTLALKLKGKVHATEDNPISSYLPTWMVRGTSLHESFVTFDNINIILESTSYNIGGYIKWETFSGDKYEGTIYDVEDDTLHVHCVDGVDRAVGRG